MHRVDWEDVKDEIRRNRGIGVDVNDEFVKTESTAEDVRDEIAKIGWTSEAVKDETLKTEGTGEDVNVEIEITGEVAGPWARGILPGAEKITWLTAIELDAAYVCLH